MVIEEDFDAYVAIRNWSEADRPREKMMQFGRRALSDAELIAVLIGSGTQTESAVSLSRRILFSNKHCLNRLATLDISDLMAFKGIGLAKAVAIVAALELGRRRKDTSTQAVGYQVTGSVAAYEALKGVYKDLNHEEFWVLLLNAANRIVGKKRISTGGRTGTLVDPKLVFSAALRSNCNSIILSHNHPSGNLKPSEEDLLLTAKLRRAGDFLNVNVLDHLIFGGDDYYSFIDEGLME